MRRSFLPLLVAGLATGVLSAQPSAPELFLDAGAAKGRTMAAMAAQSATPGLNLVRSRRVRLNLAAIDPDAPGAQAGRRVRLNLFSGIEPEIEEIYSRRGRRPGTFRWFGRPANDQVADVVLSVNEGRVSGSFALRQGFFQIRHVGGDLHEIAEVEYDRSQPVGDTLSPPLTAAPLQEAKAFEGSAAKAAASKPIADILVVYTPGARQKAGGSQAIQDRIDLAITEANSSFVNSGAGIEYRLAGVAEMNIGGTPSPTGAFLNQVTMYEPELKALREYYGADIVSVWVENTAAAVVGIAWLNPGVGFGFSSYAYGVVSVAYANGPFYAFSHESGHNLGAHHNREHASSAGAYSYSYGYRYDPNPGGGFFTIMAYSSGCGGCVGSNRWSNPNLLFDGVPTGVPQGQPNEADNAATLTNMAPSVAGFRPVQTPPVNRPPTAVNQTLKVASAIAAPITLAGSDPEGHTVYFDIVAQPLHGTLSGGGADWTYTGNVGYSGSDSFQFQVRDHLGGFAIGTVALDVKLPVTAPPTVSLAEPTGAPFVSPAAMTLVATATDSDGSVDHVDFLANGVPLGSANSTNSQFSLQWGNALQGEYDVTAVAYDNLGVKSTSTVVHISVGEGEGGQGYTNRMARLFYAFDEGVGATVFDHVGASHGTVGGGAAWTALGLKGGYANSGVTTFSGNRLSAFSRDAFTIVWVGRLGASDKYQTVFSMGEAGGANILLRYYKPNGQLYLTLNGNAANYYNATSLFDKNVMIALRCAGGACSWRLGGSGAWMNAKVGASAAANPLLQVGADPTYYSNADGNTSALFWVYADSLTDEEIGANFQYAGAALAARGHTLEGYVPNANSFPTAYDQSLSTAYQTPLGITLTASDSDADRLSFSIVAGPAHGTLSGQAPALAYTPASGYYGPDSFTFQVSDGKGGTDTGLISLDVAPPPNAPPTVSLSVPAGGPFTAPTTIVLAAAATDSDGSVTHVEFFANGESLGQKTSPTSTFQLDWTGMTPGSYTIFARAVDNFGATADSASIAVEIGAPIGAIGEGYTTRQSLLFYSYEERFGLTVFDRIGKNHGAIAGQATWAAPGLKGGYVNTGVSSFSGNRLSAASGDAFTIVWVGRLGPHDNYQTLFSMGDAGGENLLMRYYKPNGYLYLALNKDYSNYLNASGLYDKSVLIALRCAEGACAWRVGGSGGWKNASVGAISAVNPLLLVGADPRHYADSVGNTAALFWVYGDALTDQEISANFQYAGAALAARGHTLDGYVPGTNNNPTAHDQTLSTPYQTPLSMTLSATDPDSDTLSFATLGSPAHGSLSGAAPNLTYTPAAGYSGPDSFTFQVTDNKGGSDTGSISITVGGPPNAPPTSSLAMPVGDPFTAPAGITLVATATDPDGSVDHVEFFANGSSIGAKTSANSTFSFTWNGVAAGTYTVFARSFDNLGLTADSAPISVQVNALSGGGDDGYTTRQGLLLYTFDEGAGTKVYDQIGASHGTVGGAATWTASGLKGGYVETGVTSFSGNRLSAASGDAFTLVWAGRLDAHNAYQTLFSMGAADGSNVLVRYYQPNGYLYLGVNQNNSNYLRIGNNLDKNVMVVVRCAGGSCSWRVGGSGAWTDARVGSASSANPSLLVGADPRHYSDSVANTASLFWVYGDALTDQEIAANFQYAGGALAARGQSLDGYTGASNSAPLAQSSSTNAAMDRYAFVYLLGSDPDNDALTYQVTSGPSHGTLKQTPFPFHLYEPSPGFTGTDVIQFQANDGHGGVAAGTVTITVEPHEHSTSTVSTTAELSNKLRFARPGETVLIAPGVYSQAIFSTTDWGLRGTATHPIVFRALDPSNPPTIESGILLAGSSWLRFEHLKIVKPAFHNVNAYPVNGYASHDIVFDNIYLESSANLTLAANLKITRSDNVTVRNSTFYGWGDNAIDTIGLWGGVIENNRFLGRASFAQRTGLQLKGDTRDVLVRNNYFLNAGERVVQIGGGTGAQFFREPPSFEAQRVEVSGNRIVGGAACFSLVSQTGSRVHHNTCYLPKTWIARLLNENGALQPNQNGQIDHNVFVYDSGVNLEFVNLSANGGVDVDSFVFDNNAYYQMDGDSPRLPRLPVDETNMIDQVDPQIIDAGLPTMRVGSTNPIFGDVGADAVNPVS